MINVKQALSRNDSREYYSLIEIPEQALTIIIENAENYIWNHIEKLPDLTIEDVLATDQIEKLTMKDFLYIMMLR